MSITHHRKLYSGTTNHKQPIEYEREMYDTADKNGGTLGSAVYKVPRDDAEHYPEHKQEVDRLRPQG